jgi:hypothetical protein
MLEPEGALGTIVEQLDRGGSAAAREQAVVLLRKIAEHTDALNRAIGRNPAAIKTLAKFVAPGAAKVMPRAEAATTLAALARGQRANQDAIAAAGALSSLVKMLKADAKEVSAEEASAAALCLCALMAQHAENTALVQAQGGLPPLAQMAVPLVCSATQLPLAASTDEAMQALREVLQARLRLRLRLRHHLRLHHLHLLLLLHVHFHRLHLPHQLHHHPRRLHLAE